MAGYSIGESVYIRDLEYPDNLTARRPQQMVFKITGRRGVKVTQTAEEEEEAKK